MRKIILSVVITLVSIGIESNLFAETEQQLKLDNAEESIIDRTEFLTFKDERGNHLLFKTFAFLMFSDGEITLDTGKLPQINDQKFQYRNVIRSSEREKLSKILK